MRTVEIFDEENSIIVDDQYDTTDFTFYPEVKQFKVRRSVKDDCFFSDQTIEYKISPNPIELQMRTLESSHEPPKEYSIRDGVVLESELKKNGMLFPDRIENLKKEVEWSNVPVFGNYEVNLYILTKHPEVISKEDYRKFLRQSVEKIKVGISKVEEAIKGDARGLQIHTGEYGKGIWYPTSEAEEKERKEYWDLPKEKREGSAYAKKLEYVEKFNDSLFKEGSPRYVGISEYEFKMSFEIVEYVEKMLDKKEVTSATKEGGATTETSEKKKWVIFGYVWTIGLNVVSFLVILGILGSVQDNFSKIIVSSLVIIYLSIDSIGVNQGTTLTTFILGLDDEFRRLRKLLKDQPSESEIEEMREVRRKVELAKKKALIHSIFIFLAYLVAVYSLVYAF